MELSDLTGKVKEVLSGLEVEVQEREPNLVEVRVPRETLVEVAKRVKSLGFDHVKSVTAIDYSKERFEVVYHASSYSNPDLARFFLVLRTDLPYDDPKCPSLLEVWPSVLYLEHEQYDLMGVEFEGHPRKERRLLPEDYEGIPPLRKEFKIKTEGINA